MLEIHKHASPYVCVLCLFSSLTPIIISSKTSSTSLNMKPLEIDFVHSAKVEKHGSQSHGTYTTASFSVLVVVFSKKDFPRMGGALLYKQHLSQTGKSKDWKSGDIHCIESQVFGVAVILHDEHQQQESTGWMFKTCFLFFWDIRRTDGREQRSRWTCRSIAMQAEGVWMGPVLDEQQKWEIRERQTQPEELRERKLHDSGRGALF